MTRWRPAVFVLMLLAAAACASSTPLADGAASPDTLARAVLEAVRTNDRARLAALAVSEREFREHVWPRLPASRPERNLPFSYVWGDLRQKSDLALTGTIEQYRGRLFSLRKVSFTDVTDHVDYKVHREATFRVRDSTGNESDLRVCGSFLEQDGIWKVFSYVVDD
jgi:hypothetical protein